MTSSLCVKSEIPVVKKAAMRGCSPIAVRSLESRIPSLAGRLSPHPGRHPRRGAAVAMLAALGLAAFVCVRSSGAAQRSGAAPPISSSLPARLQAVPIPAGRQVFFDMASVPWTQVGPGTRRKTVLGESVTFSLTELDPQFVKGRPASEGHHHDYEQVLFGVEGAYGQSAGLQTFRIGKMTAILEPPNVQHAVTSMFGPEKAVTIEVIPLARRDLLPPRPAMTYPASPEPRPIPEGRQVYVDFNTVPWVGETGQARFKAIIGETCSFVVWHLPAAGFKGTASPGHHHTVEQISYVLEGHARMRISDQVRAVGPGTLMMIPADVEHLPMTAINNEDILLLDFQPVVREDILKRMGTK